VDRTAANSKTVDRGMLRRSGVVLALSGVFALIVVTRLPLCPMAGVLGVPCPGCGLTRATLALMRGDLRGALHLHPLVLVIAPIFIAAMASAAASYVRGPRPRRNLRPWLASRLASVLAFGLLAATLGVWSARFFGYFGGPVPVETFAAWAEHHSAHTTPRD
jgi:Protein of unknown function (DUF2752)